MRKTITILAMVSISLSTVSSRAAQSTFDTDAEGWTMMCLWTFDNPPTGDPGSSLTWESATGNPGGCIGLTEYGGPNDTFKAPAEYLGDKSSAFGTDLTFDLWTSRGTSLEEMFIALVGSSTTLYYMSAVSGGSWNHFQIPLVGSGWKKNSPLGPDAMDADMLDVLGNVSALYIWGDFTYETDEYSRLDNVFVAEAPVGIDVEIDIKPGSYPSSINLGKKGVTPVAIHTTDDFDATTVDSLSVRLNDCGPPVNWEAYDCDELPNPLYDDPLFPDEPEMIGDGDIDLVLYFDTQALAEDECLAVGDTEATLTGVTFGGVPIEGTGDVRIMKGPKS